MLKLGFTSREPFEAAGQPASLADLASSVRAWVGLF
jgi:hypothetical protein